MTDIRIGTSGWHYDHWRGVFYPEDLPKAQWFRYYARRFTTVELNNSFYRQPSDSAWQAWHDEAPPGFRFAVKANRFITHIKRFKDPEQPVATFLKGARKLKTFLGPVLYQASPAFHRTGDNVERLEAFLEQLPGERSVLEFRHNSWFVEETLELLQRRHVALCVHDMPGLKCPRERTASFVYVRLHGPRKAYAGKYTDADLDDWAEAVHRLARGDHDVWVYFNNDLGGHAVVNARQLSERLGLTVSTQA